ncbi:MAG: tyrosine-type recombinase/integrase [Alphaproteobacteria bacterium]|nr:tyrosine-type recombinase/integrase [Alphaproteobacteria bacterium]
MSKNQRLFKRNNIFYLRVSIPRNMAKILGVKEIKRSLKTSSYDEALIRLRSDTADIDKMIVDFSKKISHSLCEEIKKMEINEFRDKRFLVLEKAELDNVIYERFSNLYVFYKMICDIKEDKERLENEIKRHYKYNYFDYDLNKYDKYIIETLSNKFITAAPLHHREKFAIEEKVINDVKNGKILLRGCKPYMPCELENMYKIHYEVFDNIKYPNLLFNENVYNLKSLPFEVRDSFIYIDTHYKILYEDYFIKGKNIKDFDFSYELKEWEEIYRLKNNIVKQTDFAKRLENLNKQFKLKYSSWYELFQEMWKKKKNERPDISQESFNNYKRVIALFFQLFNTNKIEDITKENCLTYIEDYLYRIPRNYTKIKRYQYLSAMELLLKEGDVKNRLCKKTLQTYVTPIKEIFHYAYIHDLVDNDFSSILKSPTVTRHDKLETRTVFSKADIKAILENLPPANQNPTNFFVPLIAMFSGARLNEICQLTVDDIGREGQVYYFYINDNSNVKSVKNSYSIRKVPIHNMLIKLGFWDYVKYRRTDTMCNRVFKDVTYNEHNNWGGLFSKRFSRLLDKAKIKRNTDEGKKCFHSFRHTFTTQAQECGISTEFRHIICGWQQNSIGESIYGNHVKLSTINKELQKVEYKGLKVAFNKLKKWKP